MAIIRCPECGGQISSTTENCVHCGCRITVCPDCGKVYCGNIKICTACGANLSGEIINNKNSFADDAKQLEKQMQKNERTLKIVGRVRKIVDMAGIVIYFVPLVLTLYEVIDFLYGLLVFTLIFGSVLSLLSESGDDIVNYVLMKRGVDWIDRTKIDYLSYLKKDNQMLDDFTFYETLVDTAFYHKNGTEFNYFIAKIIVKYLSMAACLISAIFWEIYNLDLMRLAAFIGIEFNISNLVFNLPSFYSAVVFLVITLATEFFFWIFQSRRKKAWKATENLQ